MVTSDVGSQKLPPTSALAGVKRERRVPGCLSVCQGGLNVLGVTNTNKTIIKSCIILRMRHTQYK